MYLYYAPDLLRAALFDDAPLERDDRAASHRVVAAALHNRPRDILRNCARTHASGVVFELASGLPSPQQLKRIDAVLKRTPRVDVLARRAGGRVRGRRKGAEPAPSCDATSDGCGDRLPIDRMSAIWQRLPTGLRWIYRGEFPVRRSDILVKLDSADDARAAAAVRATSCGAGRFTSAPITGSRSRRIEQMTQTVLRACVGTGRAVVPGGASYQHRGHRRVECSRHGSTAPIDGRTRSCCAPEHYTPLVKAACQAIAPGVSSTSR